MAPETASSRVLRIDLPDGLGMVSRKAINVIYEIRHYGDPVLREEATPVDKVDDEIRQLAKDMIETMHHESSGVGLAAQQVGRTVAVCVIDVHPEYDQDEAGVRHNPDVEMPLVLINPEITDSSKETDVYDEGCLSFPDIHAPITRPVEVTVTYLDAQGRPQTRRLKKFIARVVQHEMDHLKGVLLVDRMSYLKKVSLSGQLKRLKKETQEQLAEA
jgi:peptide deformylase